MRSARGRRSFDHPILAGLVSALITFSLLFGSNLCWSIVFGYQIVRLPWLAVAFFLACAVSDYVVGWLSGSIVKYGFPQSGYRGVRGLWLALGPLLLIRTATYVASPIAGQPIALLPAMALATFASAVGGLRALRSAH
jgi:hypothetical protein